jgi:hypothetical protein
LNAKAESRKKNIEHRDTEKKTEQKNAKTQLINKLQICYIGDSESLLILGLLLDPAFMPDKIFITLWL